MCSAPLGEVPAARLFSGDVPLEEEGGYCFGKRPALYDLVYLRSDAVLTKRGARAQLHLELEPIVFDPPSQGPNYQFTQPIIDKRRAVLAKPDDVRVSGVVWEYYNGMAGASCRPRAAATPSPAGRRGLTT